MKRLIRKLWLRLTCKHPLGRQCCLGWSGDRDLMRCLRCGAEWWR